MSRRKRVERQTTSHQSVRVVFVEEELYTQHKVNKRSDVIQHTHMHCIHFCYIVVLRKGNNILAVSRSLHYFVIILTIDSLWEGLDALLHTTRRSCNKIASNLQQRKKKNFPLSLCVWWPTFSRLCRVQFSIENSVVLHFSIRKAGKVQLTHFL